MEISEIQPFGLAQSAKREFLLDELNRLVNLHYQGCPEYRKLVDVLHGHVGICDTLEALPYLPVRLFKHYELLSVPRQEIVKIMTSSGTSGQEVSKIFLDKRTAGLQIKVLANIMSNFIGGRRLPMLIVDCPSVVGDRLKFSARAAGILGFSMFGRDIAYALKDDMTLDMGGITAFLERHASEDLLVFGFTAIVWQHVVLQLEAANSSLPIDRGTLIHGGGWKKLIAASVSNEEFKDRLFGTTGISRVHNYYGMVEQTGSIFMECESGHLHSSSFSEILIRDPLDFSLCGLGSPGLIQLLSVVPHSYPGHSILSEDMGECIGVDDCPCGRQGTYFKVLGRIKNAEARGCSDTYAT